MSPISAFLAYGLSLWLGFYLLSRDITNPRLRWTGLGLVAYALALAGRVLQAHILAGAIPIALESLLQLLWFAPALCWTGAAAYLLPEDSPDRKRVTQGWRFGQAPLTGLLYLAALIAAPNTGPNAPSPLYLAFALAIFIPLLALTFLVARASREVGPRRVVNLILVAMLFFALGTGGLLFPLNWIPSDWLEFAIGIDLALLGVTIGLLDAFEMGEAWRPDFTRSLVHTGFTALAFVGPVALTAGFATGLTPAMAALLLVSLFMVVAVSSQADALQTQLDRISFAPFPHLREERASLRAEASLLPRVNANLDLRSLDEEEFARLTRQALSQYGNLPRLAANPLTGLPVVHHRLSGQNTPASTLERAAELKALLHEAIDNLKPRNGGDFGTSDEWRFYNALYFPYVKGIKPYSRRSSLDELDGSARQAFQWFRVQVPERTLYNWQQSAARLIARYLREMIPE